MARKKYDYSNVEGVNTLRLVLDFSRLGYLDVVCDAYSLLSTKGKTKARTIAKAIEYYEANLYKNQRISRAMAILDIASKAKERYNLKTDAELIDLLSVDLDSDRFRSINIRIPPSLQPRKMLCGFTYYDPKMEALHKRLFSLSMNERIMLVSNAITAYAVAAMDPEWEDMLIHKFIRDAIVQYQKYPMKRKQHIANLTLLLTA